MAFYRGAGKSIIGGGQIFIYSCSASFISFVFTVCEHEYMNIWPPNYRLSGAPGFLLINIHQKNHFPIAEI
jgi:hypothetical protein